MRNAQPFITGAYIAAGLSGAAFGAEFAFGGAGADIAAELGQTTDAISTAYMNSGIRVYGLIAQPPRWLESLGLRRSLITFGRVAIGGVPYITRTLGGGAGMQFTQTLKSMGYSDQEIYYFIWVFVSRLALSAYMRSSFGIPF